MTYVYDTEEGRAKQSARASAFHAARLRLIEAHREEYERYHREERVARGLPPDPTPKAPRYTELRERVAELEAELARLRAGE